MRPKTSHSDLPPRMLRRTRTFKKTGKTYDCFYFNGRTADGKRIEIALGTDLNEAKRKWLELDVQKVQVVSHVMRDIFDRYIRDIIPTKGKKTQYENGLMFKWLRPVFDSVDIDTITPQHIAVYRDKRGAKAPVRANREIALLSHVFNMAREWGLTAKENPCRGVRKNKETGRDYYADGMVWDAVYAVACDELRDAMDLAYLTGQRPADVREMKMSDIQDGELIVQQNKTSKRLRIEIIGQLAELIAARRRLPVINQHIIVTRTGHHLTPQMMRKRWEKARDLAADANPEYADKIRGFQFRDIRPKAASETDVTHAKELLGHSSERITRDVYRRAGERVKPTKY